jgi:hypothetical protein
MPVSNDKRKNGKVVPYQAPPEKSKRDQFIAEANAIKIACLGLITNCANVSGIIKAASACDELKLDEPRVGKLANSLGNDLKTLKGELDSIDSACNSRLSVITAKTDDIDVMNITVQIGTEYQNWQDRFIQITSPVMEEITELCTGEI